MRTVGWVSEEAGQEFYCTGHPTRILCASVLSDERPLRSGAPKSTPGGAPCEKGGAPLAQCSEFLPSFEALPINLVRADLMGNASLTHPTLPRV